MDETPDVLQGAATAPFGRTMTKWEQRWSDLKRLVARFRRRLPYLVWYGDEVDVGVTLKDIGALGGEPSRVWEAQTNLRDMGITFDGGAGNHGMDWEWGIFGGVS